MSKKMDNRRLMLECRVVREHFGDRTKLCTNSRRERVWWECGLPGGSQERAVFVFYPDDYPDSPPTVVYCSRLQRHTPHVMCGNVLDVCYAAGFWNSRCTAATAML
jgi:hypothetical protein